MKRAAFIAVIISLLLSACKTQQQAVSLNNDDVYSTPSRQQAKTTATPVFNQDLTSALATNQGVVSHDSLKANASTLDYSDLSYANRLQKFQHPQGNTTYFSNTAVDSNYVSNDNPNVSINFGYGGGAYDWGMGMGFGMGFGWGYPYWGYGWGYPYYGWGYGWGYPYWGCNCCNYPYWDGGGYYNSYYGPRQSALTTTAYTRTTRGDATTTTNPGNSRPGTSAAATPRGATAGATPRGTTAGSTPRNAAAVTTQRNPPASQERYHYTRPATSRQGTSSRNPSQGNTSRDTRQQPSPRYVQPGSAPVQRQ